MEARVVPRFDTKGNVDHAIALLHNWLLLNASYEYEGVVIVAHSMGALIAADALLKIASHREKHTLDSSSDETLQTMDVDILSSDPAWEASKSAPQLKKDTPTSPPHLNIIALLCFDSPFFGLNPNVFANAAGTRASELITSYIPPDSFPRRALAQVGQTIHSAPVAISSGVYAGASAISSTFYQGASAVSTSVSDLASTAYGSIPTASYISHAVISTPSVIVSAPNALLHSLPNLSNFFSYGSNSNIPIAASKPEKSVSGSINEVVEVNTLCTEDVTGTVVVEQNILDVENWSNDASSTDLAQKAEMENVGVFNLEEFRDNEPSRPLSASLSSKGSHISKNGSIEDNIYPRYQPELLPTSSSSNYSSSLLKFGVISGAVMAGGAYYSGGLVALGSMTLARRIAVAYALSHVDSAREHLQFLYPLWGESESESSSRVEKLIAMKETGKFEFKCFFIEVFYLNYVRLALRNVSLRNPQFRF
jgi:hypothetical protein